MSLNKNIDFHVGMAMLMSVNQLVTLLNQAVALSKVTAELNPDHPEIQKCITRAQSHAENLELTLLEEIIDEED